MGIYYRDQATNNTKIAASKWGGTLVSNFQTLTMSKVDKYIGPINDIHAFHVTNPHALIRAVGYLKYTAEPYERIYFRGQRKIYETFSPGLYRGISTDAGRSKKEQKLNKLVKKYCSEFEILSAQEAYVPEGILQHYGVPTTWLDVVDNIWVALWFATNRAQTVGKNQEFLNFQPINNDPENSFGYIVIVVSDYDMKKKPLKGLVRGRIAEVMDLRIAAPSIFLRPHSQHALLFRQRATSSDGRSLDYKSNVAGIIRFKISDAQHWIGEGEFTKTRGLFPSPYFDQGYKLLLEKRIDHEGLGSIQHIGT